MSKGEEERLHEVTGGPRLIKEEESLLLILKSVGVENSDDLIKVIKAQAKAFGTHGKEPRSEKGIPLVKD